jgi:nucleotide-binding universal stress UspA family protein
MPRKILVPYDFSPCADAAVEFAKKMVERLGAIRLVFAVERSAPVPYGAQVALGEALPRVQGKLEKLALEISESADVRTSSEVVFGSPWRVAVAEAAKMKADAVFMGSHGRHGGLRVLLGSVAERVIRESSVPVCVVKAGKVTAGKIRRIGLATDLTAASAAAEKIARELAKRQGATLDVIHVFEDDGLCGEPLETVVTARLTAEQAEQLERDRDVRRLGRKIAAEGIETRNVVTVGDVPERLTGYAERQDLDLLIMGTHARKGLSRVVLGSIAAETMRGLRCPLMVVPQ